MASARRDDLAKRLAERLDKAPVKGRAMSTPALAARESGSRSSAKSASKSSKPNRRSAQKSTPKPQRSSPPAAKQRPERGRRGAAGTVLRGHLVPEAVHGEARRRKAAMRTERDRRLTWNDVMLEGVELLVSRPPAAVLAELDAADPGTTRRRLVQATLPLAFDQRLVELQLDLDEIADRSVTYEQLWTEALRLWLRSSS